jgi:hypothetical protein
MSDVAIRTLHLGTIIRDSLDGQSWRRAWADIVGHAHEVLGAATPPTPETKRLVRCILELRTTIQRLYRYHPVLFAYFVAWHTGLDSNTIRNHLSVDPGLLALWNRLEGAFQAIGLIVTFLRRAGLGYPYPDLVHTLPLGVWTYLGRVCEIPWTLSHWLNPGASPSDSAHAIGLEHYIPSVSEQTAQALDDLASSVRQSQELRTLNTIFRALEQHDLVPLLREYQGNFQADYDKLVEHGTSGHDLDVQTMALLLQTYHMTGRSRAIRDYTVAFEQYEALLQRIYWLLSHLVFNEVISCITTEDPEQLQQIISFHGEEICVTATAPTHAKTLRTGQLVHLTLPETEHALDGIYQIDRWSLKWSAANGVRAPIYIKATKHWHGKLDRFGTSDASTANSVFVPSELAPTIEIVDDTIISFVGEETAQQEKQFRDRFTALEMDQALGFPWR